MIINQGDIITINAEPHSGHEMGGHNQFRPRRLMVVISNNYYNHNHNLSLLIGMPITSQNHANNPIYYPIKSEFLKYNHVHGYIVTFQLQNFDYKSKQARVIDHITSLNVIQDLSEAGKDIIDVIN